ncbi:MAG: Spy/CpxP family protein refolding chaperone [Pseudolabrys sp.]
MKGWKHSWNHWGNPYWRTGWNGGWGGWIGPVFWPYVYGDFLSFVFWPYGYYNYPFWYDPFWAYGDVFLWNAIFWPGPFYGPYYAYAPEYYDVYGDYAYADPPRRRAARRASREIAASTSNNLALAQICSGLAPGITDLPIDRIEKSLRLTDEQLKALDALKAASSQARATLKASCSSEVPLTPVGRLDAMQQRLDGMIRALGTIRTPLDDFYNSLNEEQRHHFAKLGPRTTRHRRRAPSANGMAALCSRRTESFTQLPVQRIQQVLKPTQDQQEALDKLKVASAQAANQLQASCPTDMPRGPIDRFDAVSKRLDAMSAAIKTVRPALDSFYASLTDEQKARFNVLGPPETTASDQR